MLAAPEGFQSVALFRGRFPQLGWQGLVDVDDAAISDLRDDHGIKELPIDAVGILTADDERALYRREGPLSDSIEHGFGVDRSSLLDSFRQHVNRNVVGDDARTGWLVKLLLICLSKLTQFRAAIRAGII